MSKSTKIALTKSGDYSDDMLLKGKFMVAHVAGLDWTTVVSIIKYIFPRNLPLSLMD